jgi:hypothetical protein
MYYAALHAAHDRKVELVRRMGWPFDHPLSDVEKEELRDLQDWALNVPDARLSDDDNRIMELLRDAGKLQTRGHRCPTCGLPVKAP